MKVDEKGLRDVSVCLLDGQTTGASPAHGQLLEVAWGLWRGVEGLVSVEESLVALEAGGRLPRRVSKMTGIGVEDVEGAPGLEAVYGRLVGALGVPWVVHYARFEKAFLETMFARFGAVEVPEIVCTHEIARRLFPDLPRRGLRPLVGYLGHGVPDLKRAGDYVRATASIWEGLVEVLVQEEGVDSLEALRRWLAETKPASRKKYAWPMPRGLRLGLPSSPGVYRMVDGRGEVLYVGKAINLRRRVNGYFQKRKGHPERTMELLTRAKDLDVTHCASGLEASLLESDEIKRLAPAYNIALHASERSPGFFNQEMEPVALPVAEAVGPLPSLGSLRGVRRLAALWGGAAVQEGDASVVLRLRPRWCPEAAMFEEAVEALRQRWSAYALGSGLEGWLGLGLDLWEAEGAQEDTEDEEQEGGEGLVWTVEAVTQAVESVVRMAARRVRRSRWMTRVCDGALLWRPAHTPLVRRALVWEAGLPLAASCVASGVPPLVRRRGVETRQGAINVGAYDRLLVLSMELRRMVAADPGLRLRVADGEVLGAQEVEAALALF